MQLKTPQTDVLKKSSKTRFVPRVPEANEAKPRTQSYFEGTYDGKELFPFTLRPGANNAFKIPSLGH